MTSESARPSGADNQSVSPATFRPIPYPDREEYGAIEYGGLPVNYATSSDESRTFRVTVTYRARSSYLKYLDANRFAGISQIAGRLSKDGESNVAGYS